MKKMLPVLFVLALLPLFLFTYYTYDLRKKRAKAVQEEILKERNKLKIAGKQNSDVPMDSVKTLLNGLDSLNKKITGQPLFK